MRIQQTLDQPFSIDTSSHPIYNPHYHTHTHYEIYYFRSGNVNYMINDRIYVLAPGDLLIMHGMTMHMAHNSLSAEYIRTIIHFDPFYFRKYIQPPYATDLLLPFQRLQNIRLRLTGSDREEVEQLLDRMVTVFKGDAPSSRQRFQAMLTDLLLQLGDLCKQPLQNQISFPSAKEQHVQSIMSFIEHHYPEDITLPLMENSLHLSKYYLAKTFKEVTGMTIFQFLMQRRLYQAKLLLIEEELSITSISYETGFKHPAHFSRAFKQHTQSTPEQYRKLFRLKK